MNPGSAVAQVGDGDGGGEPRRGKLDLVAAHQSRAPSGFDEAISLAPGSVEGVFTGVLDPAWWGGIGPHGGYLAAILVHALKLSAERGRRTARSLTVHYARPAREGPFELRCVAERTGGALATVGLRILQGGEPVVVALGATAAARSSPEFNGRSMPQVPRWSDVPVSEFLTGRGVTDVAPAFARQLEYRHCIGPQPLTGASQALTGGWLRLRGERPLDLPAAALLMDAWWPAAWSCLRSVPRTPTIDLTLHFRQSVPPTPEPVLAIFRTELADDGFIDEEGELWSADGRLLVQSRQLAVLLASPDLARESEVGGQR